MSGLIKNAILQKNNELIFKSSQLFQKRKQFFVMFPPINTFFLDEAKVKP